MNDLEFSIKFTENQIKEFTKNLKDTYSVFELTKNELGIDFRDIEFEINYYCFITSSFLDLLTIIKGYQVSKGSWERIFYLKNGYLVIYETIKTYNKLSKEISNLIHEKYSSFIMRYTEIAKKIRQYKKEYEYETFITEMRNNTSGHRDSNFEKYFSTILSMQKRKNIDAIQDFQNILYDIMNLSYEIATFGEENPNLV